MDSLEELLLKVRACRTCVPHLPCGPRPVLRLRETSRLLIIGQAPGTKVHDSGIPWDDASGDRLRKWLDIDRDAFYDERRVAIIPMGFCYPGLHGNGGDLPPRRECAPLWHTRLLSHLPSVSLTLLVGSFAQRYYLGRSCGKSVTETVYNWQQYVPRFLPLPHPSWRTRGWVLKNEWYERDLLPELRRRIIDLLS